jgi:hypothetical protein
MPAGAAVRLPRHCGTAWLVEPADRSNMHIPTRHLTGQGDPDALPA